MGNHLGYPDKRYERGTKERGEVEGKKGKKEGERGWVKGEGRRVEE